MSETLIQFIDYLKENKKEEHYSHIKKNKISFFDYQMVYNKIYTINGILRNNIDYENIYTTCNFNFINKNIEIPKKYNEIKEKIIKLQNIPQYEQKSDKWHEYRRERITASDCAAAIDENPYESRDKFIIKKVDPPEFITNENCAWGCKYENVALNIYKNIFNVNVDEYGALPSDKYPILGASPDGICSWISLDNKFSKKIGRMVEIKCPKIRQIVTRGTLDGDICKHYYYLQVQQQLQCCDLDKCDFWQCKFVEYENRLDYLKDKCYDTEHTFNCDVFDINPLFKKGIIIQLYPKNFIKQYVDDNIEWHAKYIYPNTVNMTEQEYNIWFINEMSNLKNNDYYFNKCIYWKLQKSHNQIIMRDDKLFDSIYPKLEETWKNVLYYRQNTNAFNEFKKKIEINNH